MTTRALCAILVLLLCACGEQVEVNTTPIEASPEPAPEATPEATPEPSVEEPEPSVAEPDGCVDVFDDADMDGFGVGEPSCGQPGAGQAADGGDCGPDDLFRHPGASEICGDWVDDDCDGADATCPTSQPSVNVPEWDCAGAPPSNVVAWARFDNGGGYFRDGGCFFFFEGAPGEFYVRRNVQRASEDPSCESRSGCTCPSLNGWPAYDRRMYAFTTAIDQADCPEISIRDHGGEQQPVSNACRKYLYQMHQYDIPFSFLAGDFEALQQRLERFPTVEIACVRDAPHANLPFQPLVSATVQLNPGFVGQ